MRRMSAITAVFGLMLLTACGGGATTTPSGTAPPPTAARPATAAPTATRAPTAVPVATPAPTIAPVETLESTAEPVETLPAETTPVGTPGDIDYCMLLTTDEVSSALSEPVTDGMTDVGSCGWAPSDSSGNKLLTLEGLSASDYDGLKTLTDVGITTMHVSGIGDDAFVQSMDAGVTVLYVLKGSTAIEILVVAPDLYANDIATIETTLGAKAAPRL